MKRPGRRVGKAVKKPRRKSAATKRFTRTRSVASRDLQAQVTTLERELTEAREQQTATSEVLKVISSSPGELGPVFEAMLENATRICDAKFATMSRFDGELFHHVADLNLPPRLREFLRGRGAFRPQPGAVFEELSQTKTVAHIEDDAARPTPSSPAKLGGARTTLAIPMLKDDELVGAFFIYRQEVRPFTDKQIELVQNFAAQAVIAIENTRLLNELRQRTDDLSEALDQQTATSEVLKVISSSPGDLEPVFDILLTNATRMCGAKFGALSLREGDLFRAIANVGAPPAFAERLKQDPIIRVTPGHNLQRLVLTKAVVHIPDLASDKGAAPLPYEFAGRQGSSERSAVEGRPVDRLAFDLPAEKGTFFRQCSPGQTESSSRR